MRIGEQFKSARLGVVTITGYCGPGTWEVRARDGRFYRYSGMALASGIESIAPAAREPQNLPDDSPLWAEYDHAAEWCARRGIAGKDGDPLPALMDARVVEAIAYDPEAFESRVRECAYGRAMESRRIP